MGTEFRAGESDGFTGGFWLCNRGLGICSLRTTDANRSRFTHVSLNLQEVREVIREIFFPGSGMPEIVVCGNQCKKGSAPGGSASLRPPSEELAEFVQNGDGQAEPDNGNIDQIFIFFNKNMTLPDRRMNYLHVCQFRRFCFFWHNNFCVRQ